MKRWMLIAGLVLSLCGFAAAFAADEQGVDVKTVKTWKDVQKLLNEDETTVKGRADAKSYPVLFAAYVKLTKPPFEISEMFNLSTIHPKMKDWSKVSGWAESNPDMTKAILESKSKKMAGLPYGKELVEPQFVSANLFVDIGEESGVRNMQFGYEPAMNVIAAFAIAEAYRLLEAGKIQEGLDVAVAHIWVVRQFCDRQFLSEKLQAMDILNAALSNLRDLFFVYLDKITAEQYAAIAKNEIPFLRPDRNELLMPEADMLVAAAQIHEVFDAKGQPDVEKFSHTFAAIQAEDAPLELFGAYRRWAMIAKVHSSRDASLQRLKLVYDDWWRRWRLPQYDQLMALSSQFARTNPVRYAAVTYSLQNLQNPFVVRNALVANVNGTALCAGLCAYKKKYNNYPNDKEKIYAEFVRRVSDIDPFDKEDGPMEYKRVDSDRMAIDTPWGRIWVEKDGCTLYAKGENNADDGGAEHTDEGSAGDLVMWPAIKAAARQAGLLP